MMNHAFFIRGLDAFGNLPRNLERLFNWQRSTLQPIGERLAFR